MTSRKEMLSRWRVPILVTVLAFVLMRCVLFLGYVPTESMEPTLEAGRYILGYRHFRELEVGDIIVFHHDNQLLVKRIAACPGDEVDLRELRYMKDTVIPVWEKPVLTVPENCYYVLGDNVDHSFDSRYWDDPFVKREDVVAVLFIN